MARKVPVPESERAICRRLLSFRRDHLLLSRVAAARRLGMDSARLASYEYGRVPLRFSFADHFASTFNVSQVWLATGKEHPTPYLRLPAKAKQAMPGSELFSVVWERWLQPALSKARSEGLSCALEILTRPPKTLPSLEESKERISRLYELACAHLEKYSDLQRWEFQERFGGALMQIRWELENPTEDDDEDWLLTDTSTSDKVADVRTLRDLFQEVEALAKGKKAELAKTLGVAPETLSRYLSGTMEPGGAVTLKLLSWVEAQRRQLLTQQKTPGSVNTTPKGTSTRRKARS